MKRFNYILYILIGVLLVSGCRNFEDDLIPDYAAKNAFIELQCVIEDNGRIAYTSGDISTKTLINQTSNTTEILCNFLRLDEKDGNDWAKAYLSEGTVATVPNGDNHLRAISLHPAQPYNTTDKDSKSKMIGWYPRAEDVPQDAQGNDVTVQYENFTSTCVVKDNKTCVKFTGLDGSRDIMVSEMKEGSFNTNFESFTFKHYLSAIRVYAKAEKSGQDIGLWKEIEEVVIRKQPTSCVVELPSDSEADGAVVEWGTENAKFKIQKNHIFGEHDTDYADNQVPEKYPIKIEGSNIEKYLGYSLIQPNSDLTLQVHTNAGVYNVVVGTGADKTQVFKPGYIYDIHITFKTDGTIFAYIENDGGERYFDLSTGHEYSNEDGTTYSYKNANCYIINSSPDQSSTIYDGFCFDATVVGNGQAGVLSTGAQTFYPQNAHIEPCNAEVLWQTSPRLISQVELLYGYVRFKVAKETENTYKEGNAVIAVYDKDMNVLWSWHIWITDTPADLTYVEDKTSVTIMDRNLGAVLGGVPLTDTEALNSYGLYYQWGRKDPSMGPPTYDYSPINMTTAPYYDYSSEKREAAEVVRLAEPTLRDAVENPMFLIMPTMLTQTYYFNWLYEKIDFLWGYDKNTGYTEKSIYDPCPYGYRVSGGELADLFTYASQSPGVIENDTYGQVVKVPKVSTNANDKESFFFPYSGYKGVDRGLNSLISSWKYVGKKGDYQSSIVSMYTGDNEYYMHRSRIYLSKDRTWSELNVGDYTGHQIQDHTNRRTAAPVRCVKDDKHKRLMVFITPDKYTVAGADEGVDFTLYANAFGSIIKSATLSVGYHLKGSEDAHRESVIASWDSFPSDTWTYELKSINNYIYDEDGNSLDLDSTTGELRFILTVKSEDNINKQSSTTIRLQKNYVEFLNWADKETLFANTDIDKSFRIYGDSEPEKVEIMQVGKDGQADQLKKDVTEYLQKNSGSEYPYDYNCSTAGLTFSSEGEYDVYLKITLANGQELISDTKKLIIEAQQWVEVTSVSDLNSTGTYLIMNVNSDDFAYDNGSNIQAKAVYDETCYFSFSGSGSSFKIKNTSSGEYAGYNSGYLIISGTNQNSASSFTIAYTDGYFKISYKSGYRTYYWQQASSPGEVTLATTYSTSFPANMRWKIYKKSTN